MLSRFAAKVVRVGVDGFLARRGALVRRVKGCRLRKYSAVVYVRESN